MGVGKNDEGAIIIIATLTSSTATGNVKFKFDGDVITYASTISNGKATLISPYSKDGVYNLVVSYDGDDNFKAAPTMDFSFLWIRKQKSVCVKLGQL